MICRAVIFDLDGTLLDTLDDLTAAVNYALAAHGMPTHTRDEVCRFVGNGVRLLMLRAVPEGTDEGTFETVYADFRQYYKAHSLVKTAPYPGIAELLTAVADAGLKTAILSNKMQASMEDLCRHFFPTVTVAIGDDGDRPLKPDPAGLNTALARLGVAAEDAIFVGDSDVDIATARNAGMRCLSAGWGFREPAFLRAHGATQIAATPGEVLTYLRNGACE